MTDYQQIIPVLYTELAAITKATVAIDENTELTGDLKLDSLQMMELLLIIEDHFDISVPVNVLSDVKTIKDFALQIENLIRCE
ncbi:MAG: acyl carrier protein [Gammaproteobacteria bacterium]|nr:acyl carrier protein [Gammaproteobacteria bacterium]